MTSTTLDLVCAWTAGITGVVGTILLIWSLAWDRARGRQRCPRCWYDMKGAPALTCPECGHNARRPARLQRTRRRWRWATVAMMLLFIALATGYGPGIWRNGWRQSVPDAVLVTLWPLSAKDWIASTFTEGGQRTGMVAELQSRIARDDLSEWAEARWASRVEAQFRRDGCLGLEEIEPVMRKIRGARITRTFTHEPLEAVFEALGKELGVSVRVDWTYVDEYGAPRDHRVSFSLTHCPGEEAFGRVFRTLGRLQVFTLYLGVDEAGLVIGSAETTPQGVFNHDLREAQLLFQTWYGPAPAIQAVHLQSMVGQALIFSIERQSTGRKKRVGRLHPWIQHHLVGPFPTRDLPSLTRLADCLNHPEPHGLRSLDPEEWRQDRDALLLLRRSVVRLPAATPTAREIAVAVTEATGIPVDLDWSGFDTSGMCNRPVAAGPKDTTAYEALERMAARYWQSPFEGPGAGWTLWRGAVRLFRADTGDACTLTDVGVYGITDYAVTQTSTGRFKSDNDASASALARQIMRTDEPTQWPDAGGSVGSVDTRGPILVITTTSKQHLMIEELLANLRAKHKESTPPPPP